MSNLGSSVNNKTPRVKTVTTGQIIDSLSPNKLAECYSVGKKGNEKYVGKMLELDEWGMIRWIEEGEKEGELLKIDDVIRTAKWILKPKIISFEEAKLAMEDGKTVIFYFKGKGIKMKTDFIVDSLRNFYKDNITWNDFFTGKWSIEDE